jgi:hypothetical protein
MRDPRVARTGDDGLVRSRTVGSVEATDLDVRIPTEGAWRASGMEYRLSI